MDQKKMGRSDIANGVSHATATATIINAATEVNPRKTAQLNCLQSGKPTHWLAESDGHVCEDCHIKFSLLTRRHHCRMCGYLLCASCLSCTVNLLAPDGSAQVVKVCVSCRSAFDTYAPDLFVHMHIPQQQKSASGRSLLLPLAKASWVPNSQATACMLSSCATPFNISHRRHHCRFCAVVACDSCTSNRTRIDKQLLRTCPGCFDQQILAGAGGSGAVTTEGGCLLKGNFVNGLLEGEGRCTTSSGAVYVGMFKEGKKHGFGTLTTAQAQEHYSGQWMNNLRHGLGETTWRPTGGGLLKSYKGNYADDCWSGTGELTYFSGDIYVGQFRQGTLHGKGDYRYSSGLIFSGTFERNAPTEGKLTYPASSSSSEQHCSLSSVLAQLPSLSHRASSGSLPTRDLLGIERHTVSATGTGAVATKRMNKSPISASMTEINVQKNCDFFEGFLHGQNVAEGYFWSSSRQAKFAGTFFSDWRDLPQSEGLTKGTITTDDKVFVYSGDLNNWLPRGQGVLTTSSNSNRSSNHAGVSGDYKGGFFQGMYRGWGSVTKLIDAKEITTYYFFGVNGSKYAGDMKDSEPHGKGTRYYSDWSVEYAGEWKEGLRNGIGNNCYVSNASYEGNWSKDQRSGEGVQIYANGDRYKGLWKEDKRSGLGQYFFANGDIYEGMWSEDEREGAGSFLFHKDSLKSVQGEWKTSALDITKTATVTWINFDVYEGQVNALYQPHGFGSLKLTNGDIYQGEFQEGKRNHWGKFIKKHAEQQQQPLIVNHFYWRDGRRYEGQMSDNKPWGKGTLFFPSEDVQYTGEWKDGLRSGQGIEYFVNGDKYEGEFMKDVFMGRGTMAYANGEVFNGNWKFGERNGNGTLFFANTEKRLKKVTGEWKGENLVLATSCVVEWKSGENYEGEVNDKYQRHGKGVFVMLSGHKYDGGWENDEKRGWGCYTFGDGNNNTFHCYYENGARYEGEMKDFFPHGRGVKNFPTGKVEYIGVWERGERDGHGINHYVTEDSYEGNWIKNKRHGHGTQCYANGDRYEGDWKDDKRNGKGIFFPFSGEIKSIEGEWEDVNLVLDKQATVTWTTCDSFEGKVNAKYQPHGKGVQKLANGDRYNGEWVCGERVNYGSHIRTGTSTTTYHCYWSNGNRYEGEMKDWLPSGHGTQYLANGNVEYEGEWLNNQKCGKGLSYDVDGSRYEGMWKDDKKHGEGTSFCANGDKYVGEWACGEREGIGQFFPAGGELQSVKGEWKNSLLVLETQATLIWRTGDVYVGQVNASFQPDGMGTYRFPSGDVYTGEFKNGTRRSWGELIRANGKSSHHCYWGNGERYEGEMKDRQPHGEGVKYYSKYYMTGNIEYEGEWKQGRPHGKGTKFYSNEKYEGEWSDGKRNGIGTQWLNKENYHGSWFEDERSGKGTLYFSEESGELKSVSGEWENSILCVKKTIAILIWRNEEMYEGYVNSEYQPHGKGFLITPNGNRTDGEWQAGVKVAWSRNIKPDLGPRQFSCQFYTGEKYKGEIKDGLLHGTGTKHYLTGDVYTGEWVNDMRSGEGSYAYVNGDRYEGHWEDDMKEGEGTKLYINGDRYQGNWAKGEQNGNGIFYRAQGQLLSIRGQWLGSRLLIEHSVELTWRTGERYEGSLNFNYQPHGYGTQKLTSGDKYQGTWHQGERRFWGRYIRGESGAATDHYFWPGGARYEGGKLNDEFSGKGTKYYANGGVEYEGEWGNNLRHGVGTHYAPNGERYEGEWVRDERCGQGRMTYTNGDRYEGLWSCNDRQGKGTFFWKAGERLSVMGDWDNINLVKGAPATIVWRSGDSFTGELNSAYKPHGKGVLTLESGGQYTGEWEDGVRRNWGRLVKGDTEVHHYYWTNGDRYEGSMEHFQRSGFGKQYYSEGSRYEGSWLKDQRSGAGTMYYTNGDKYEGDWVADERAGQGKYTFKGENWLSWQGEWEHDMKHGPGELTLTNGQRRQGLWIQDQRKCPFRVGQLVIAYMRMSGRLTTKQTVRISKVLIDFRCKVKIVQEDGDVSIPYIVDESDMETLQESKSAKANEGQ